LTRDVVEIEAGHQRGHRRDKEDRADHEREAAQPFDGGLDPVRPFDEMTEQAFEHDDEEHEQPDGKAHAFQEHSAERRREQLPEGLNCGGEHGVFQPGAEYSGRPMQHQGGHTQKE
jgi:hypothetical protein